MLKIWLFIPWIGDQAERSAFLLDLTGVAAAVAITGIALGRAFTS